MTVSDAIKYRQEIEREYDELFGDKLWDWYDVSDVCPDDFEIFIDLTEIIGD